MQFSNGLQHGVFGGAAGWGTALQAGKAASSILNGVIENLSATHLITVLSTQQKNGLFIQDTPIVF